VSTTISSIWQHFNELENEQPALWVNNQFYSYQQLAKQANKLSAELQKHYVHQQTVAVFTHRSVNTYCGLLGTLFSGNIFLPLNVKQPLSRVRQILESAQCQTIVASLEDATMIAELQQHFPALRIIWNSDHDLSQPCDVSPQLAARPQSERFELVKGGYAYLMFTSGSTGTPKGIGITHANLDQYVEALDEAYTFTSQDRFAQHSDLTFDLSVHDWSLAWSHGATLYVLPEMQKSCPVDFIRHHQISCLLAVPSIIPLCGQLNKLAAASIPSLRLSFFCGQALSIEHARLWAKATTKQVINLYGPTEATIAISAYEFDQHETLTGPYVPIGEIFPNQQAKLVATSSDEHPELWLRGPQVISQYWHNSIADRQAFRKDVHDGGLWYRTGDLVSRSDKGLLYHGRGDHQVKIQGHRIELGEMESVARKLNLETAAVPWPLNENGEGLGLVLFVVTHKNADIEQLKQFLHQQLPSYMQPKTLYSCQQLPLNINGKVDIKALQQLCIKREAPCY